MKKVLIVTYAFPGRGGVGGVRINGLCKYLPQFGWEPTVLTAELPGGRAIYPCQVVETKENSRRINAFKSIKNGYGGDDESVCLRDRYGYKSRIAKILKEILFYPDKSYGWYNSAANKARELITNCRYDCIISSSIPITSHIIASRVADEGRICWIAEMRDLWSQNHYVYENRLIRYVQKRLEKKTLREADCLITVSAPLAEKLRQLHPHSSVAIVLNGFDPAERIESVTIKHNFNIIYTGQVYQGKRDPMPLLDAMQELIRNKEIAGDRVEIEFYGPQEQWLHKASKRYLDEGWFKINASIPRNEALRRQASAQILLLLSWNHKEDKGVYTAKIFEYLNARRPILAIGSMGGVVEDLLRETQAGYVANTKTEIKAAVKKMYREYLDRGIVSYDGNSREIDKYSQVEMARHYASIMNGLISIPR